MPKYINSTVLVLLLAFAVLGQETTVPAVDQQLVSNAYLAKDNGGKAGDMSEDFDTQDKTIYCVVVLNSTKRATVKMNLVAVSVRGVKPETKVVSTTYTTRDGENQVSFSGQAAAKWTAGNYRADIFLNGAIARKIDFSVKASSGDAIETAGATNFAPNKRPSRKSVKN